MINGHIILIEDFAFPISGGVIGKGLVSGVSSSPCCVRCSMSSDKTVADFHI